MINRILKKYYFVFLTLVVLNLSAQQEGSFVHYPFGSQLFNPAFVGTEGEKTISSINRLQWIGFEGAPVTNALIFNSVMNNDLGIGVQMLSDRIGPLRNNLLAVDLSYHLTLNEKSHKLSVGLKASGGAFDLSLNELIYEQMSDPANQMKENYFLTNIGFGLFYYTKSVYFGFSIPYFINKKSLGLQSHQYFSAGFKTKFGDKWKINPSALLTMTGGAPQSLDLSTIFFYDESFWFGANIKSSFRNFSSPETYGGEFGTMIGLNFLQNFSFGYSYSFSLGNWASSYNNSSHEIFLRIDLESSVESEEPEQQLEETDL